MQLQAVYLIISTVTFEGNTTQVQAENFHTRTMQTQSVTL